MKNQRALLVGVLGFVLIVQTACFRVQFTSTIPRRDPSSIYRLAVHKRAGKPTDAIVVGRFYGYAPCPDGVPKGYLKHTFLRIEPKLRGIPSDSNGQVVALLPPGKYHIEGRVMGYRTADAGILKLAAGDSIFIQFLAHLDLGPFN